MARTLSSNIQTQIQSEGIRIAHLLKLEDLGASNTDLVVTNHVKDLTYNSTTYQAGGNFLDISAVEETGELVQRQLNEIKHGMWNGNEAGAWHLELKDIYYCIKDNVNLNLNI